MSRALIVVEERLGRGTGPSWAPLGVPLACIANRPLIAHVIRSLREARAEGVVVVADRASATALRQALVREDGGIADVDWVEVDAPVNRAEGIRAASDVLGGERFLLHSPDGLVLDGRETLREALSARDGLGGATSRFAPAGERLALDPAGAEAIPGWRSCTSTRALLDANRSILDGLEGTALEARWPGSRLEGRVQVHPTAQLHGAVVRGPAIIGAQATVVDAYVGPYTAVGRDVEVRNAEVESSILCRGASLCNVGVRVEASILGRGASVTRDFSLPKGLRLLVGEDSRVMLG